MPLLLIARLSQPLDIMRCTNAGQHSYPLPIYLVYLYLFMTH